MVAATLLGLAMSPAASASALDAVVEYELSAELDVAAEKLVGRGRLRWWNRTDAPVSRIRLEEGTLRVTSLAADGAALLHSLTTEPPLTSRPPATIRLPAAIPPGSSAVLDLEWEAPVVRLESEADAPTGLLLASRWFPQVVCAPGAAGTEPVSPGLEAPVRGEISRFRVDVTVPEGWELASTGIELRRERAPAAGHERVLLAADRVRDFIWCAAPRDGLAILEEDFDPLRDVPQEWLLEAVERLGVSPADLELAPVHLRIFASDDDRVSAARVLRAARASLAWIGLWHGPYPHPQLTLVVASGPPGTPRAIDGPMLLGVPPVGGLRESPPLRWPIVEAVTVHGLARQLLHGLAAPVDARREIVDEGLAIHSELSWLAASEAGPAWQPDRLWTRERLSLALPSWPWRLDRRPEGRPARATRAEARSGLVVRSMEGLVGERAFARAVRRYFELGRTGSDQAADLFTLATETSGIDLGAFVDGVVDDPSPVDWVIERVEATPRAVVSGSGSDRWRIEIDLARRGAAVGPVVVRLRWADGREERHLWPAHEPRAQWRLTSPTALAEVALDPDGIWIVETRRADNYWRAEPSGMTARVLWWIAAGAQLLRLAELPWG